MRPASVGVLATPSAAPTSPIEQTVKKEGEESTPEQRIKVERETKLERIASANRTAKAQRLAEQARLAQVYAEVMQREHLKHQAKEQKKAEDEAKKIERAREARLKLVRKLRRQEEQAKDRADKVVQKAEARYRAEAERGFRADEERARAQLEKERRPYTKAATTLDKIDNKYPDLKDKNYHMHYDAYDRPNYLRLTHNRKNPESISGTERVATNERGYDVYEVTNINAFNRSGIKEVRDLFKKLNKSLSDKYEFREEVGRTKEMLATMERNVGWEDRVSLARSPSPLSHAI